MSYTTEQIYPKCQALWIRALESPQILQFESKKQQDRGRFTFYDSVKKFRDSGVGPELLLTAIQECEVRKLDGNRIQISRKDVNPFMKAFDQELTKLVGDAQPAIPDPQEPLIDERELKPALDIEASQQKLQDALRNPTATGLPATPTSPSNPYFSREDL